MTQLLMCDPNSFGVAYEINPWMAHQVGCVDASQAIAQWEALHAALSRVAEVKVMPSDKAWPDLVFTANAGLVLPGTNQVVLANFKHPERQGEKALNRAWFEEQGWGCIELPDDLPFEGAGDALFDSLSRLWVGEGLRSAKGALPALRPYLTTGPAYGLRLVNPKFYHLDTCFCPLSRGYALAVLSAFDKPSRELLDYFFRDRLIALDESEAALFSANAVCVDDVIVMNRCSYRLRELLQARGFKVIDTPMTEFMKSGGSAKCLTLKLR